MRYAIWVCAVIGLVVGMFGLSQANQVLYSLQPVITRADQKLCAGGLGAIVFAIDANGDRTEEGKFYCLMPSEP